MPVTLENPTVLTALIVGVVTLLVGLRWPVIPLAVLVLGVPFRDFMTRWLNVHSDLTIEQVTAIGRWWFVVIAALLVVLGGRVFVQFWQRGRRLRVGWMDIALAGAIAVALVATALSPEPSAALTSVRGYLQPLAVFYLARWVKPGERTLRLFLGAWLAVGLVIAAFGLWQAAGWTEADYRAEGYVRQNGDLVVPYVQIRGQDYLRPASTVSGPNELGLDMAVLFLLAGHLAVQTPGAARWIAAALTVVFTAGLAVTVSRSGVLAYGVGIGVSLLQLRGKLWALVSSGTQRLVRVVGFLVITAAIAVAIMARSGVFAIMTQTLQTLSRQYHIVDTIEAIQFLMRQPAGVGMGLVEPKGALILLATEPLYHVEGSLLQIGMEMGLWGLGLWLWFWLLAFRRMRTLQRSTTDATLNALLGAAYASWVGALVAFVFLPLMQSISLMVWLWFLLGLAVQADEIESSWSGEIMADRLKERQAEGLNTSSEPP